MQRLSPITIFIIALAPGCAVYEQETERAIELEEPRSSGGIILRDSPSEWAERWSRTLAERERQKARAETTLSIPEVAEPPPEPSDLGLAERDGQDHRSAEAQPDRAQGTRVGADATPPGRAEIRRGLA